jgi:hypothetical protein
VCAELGNDDRSSIPIESQIVYERDLGREVKATHCMGRVVGLADSFSSIAEPPVTQDEADASESEILAMVASKATVYNSAANSVVLSVPGGNRYPSTKSYIAMHSQNVTVLIKYLQNKY